HSYGREFRSSWPKKEALSSGSKKEAATLRVTATFKSLTDKHYGFCRRFFSSTENQLLIE
ncbi:hypothetical protein, partial [Pluralibacter gergoviae]|uniref:hypothetical protein n=1 Tax=Pluralibacter gergoviae TaxID=61647 RepID=UPI001E46642C